MGVYMSTLSQFMPGGKPRQTIVYTSGAGTYTPVAPNSWCYVLLIGGGGAGGYAYGCYGTGRGGYGSSGYTMQVWTKVVSTASYAVGGGGYWTTSGYPYYNPTYVAAGATTFNGLTAGAGSQGFVGYNNGGAPMDVGLSATFSRPLVHHGTNYGHAGGGGSAGSSNGCSGTSYGGAGVGGVIVVQDFGP
jgi:hypothetical protein